MPIRIRRSAQVSGGGSFSKAGNLGRAGEVPSGVRSMPTNSMIGWRNLHFLSLTVTLLCRRISRAHSK